MNFTIVYITPNSQPIRALIIGAPASGKSVIVSQLCERYKLHHLALHNVINDAIEALQRSAARTDVTDEDEEDDGKAQEDQVRIALDARTAGFYIDDCLSHFIAEYFNNINNIINFVRNYIYSQWFIF